MATETTTDEVIIQFEGEASKFENSVSRLTGLLTNLNEVIKTNTSGIGLFSASINSADNALNKLGASSDSAFKKMQQGAVNNFEKIDESSKKTISGFKSLLDMSGKMKSFKVANDLKIPEKKSDNSNKTGNLFVDPFNALGNKNIKTKSIEKLIEKLNSARESSSKLSNSFDNISDKISETFNSISAKIVGLTATITDFVNQSAKAYDNQIKLKSVFNDSDFENVSDWIKEYSDALYISEYETAGFVAQIKTVGRALGVTDELSTQMSKNMTAAARDLSSIFGGSAADAIIAMEQGLEGNAKAMKAYGIVLNEANLQQALYKNGIDRTVSSLNSAEKAELEYYFIMQQAAAYQGTFANKLMTPATALTVIKSQFSALATEIGNVFIPILMALYPYILMITKALRMAAQAIANFFGFKINWDAAATGAAGMADNMGKTAGSAKKAADEVKQMLRDFDELHVVDFGDDSSSSSGSGSGASGGGGLGLNVDDYDYLKGASDALAEKLAKIKALLEPLSKIDLTNLKKSFDKLKTAAGALANTISKGLYWAYLNVLVPLAKWTIEDLIPAFFNNLASALNLVNTALNNGVGDGLVFLYEHFIKPIAKFTGGTIVDFLNNLADIMDRLAGWMEKHQTTVKVITIAIGLLAGTFLVLEHPILLVWAAGILLVAAWNKLYEKCQPLADVILALVVSFGLAYIILPKVFNAVLMLAVNLLLAKVAGIAFFKVFGSIIKVTAGVILAIVGLITYFKGLFDITDRGKDVVSGLSKAMIGLAVVVGGLALVFGAPVALIAAVVGAVGIFIAVVIRFWDNIKAFFRGLIDWFKESFSSLESGLKTVVSFILNPIGTIKDAFSSAGQSAYEYSQSVKDSTDKSASDVESSSGIMSGALSDVKDKMSELTSGFTTNTGDIQGVMDNLSTQVGIDTSSINGYLGTTETAVQGVTNNFGAMESESIQSFDNIGNAAQQIFGELASELNTDTDKIKQLFSGDVYGALEKSNIDFKNYKGSVSDLMNQIGISTKDNAVIVDGETSNMSQYLKDLSKDIDASTLDIKDYMTTNLTDASTQSTEVLNKFRDDGEQSAKEAQEKIKSQLDILTTNMGNSVELIKNYCNDMKRAFESIAEVTIKTPHFEMNWNNGGLIAQAFQKAGLPGEPVLNVKWYQEGGFPEKGELFVANEAGPELIGSMGNRSVVANNRQITDGIAEASYYGMKRALSESDIGKGDTKLYVGNKDFTRYITKQQDSDRRRYGRK